MGRGIKILLVLSLLFLPGCGFDRQAEPVRKSELVMDTVAQLTAEGPEAPQAVEESFARLRELEKILSNYEEGSDAARLRDNAGSGQWVQMSPEMYHLLEVSQQYSALTEGAWDITAAPLVKLWGIGTKGARVPSGEEIEQAKAKVDWRKLELNGAGGARLLEKGMELDLGGIAKGYALDEVRKIYMRHGIENGLIDLGTSSIYAVGASKERKPWRIGLRHPRREGAGSLMATAEVTDEALSTSGDYERFFEAEGVRYHHIIDPRTGYPAWCGKETAPASRPVSVLVVIEGGEPDCGMKSDLLTTALFVLGRDRGEALLTDWRDEGIEGLLVTEDGALHGTCAITDFNYL